MSEKFEWQAEDDFDWDAQSANDETNDPSPKRHRWPFLLLVLLLLAGATGLILRQVNRRVDENTQAMRADIVSSHNLLQIADADQDDELFFSVLSGSNSSWTAAQKRVFDAGLFHNRTPLGLSTAQRGESALAAEDDTLTIVFSAELREAEVVSEQPFSIEIGHDLTETVTLQETAIYRLGRERWLLSPPGRDFWGSDSSQKGSRLQITVPERDAQLARRLLSDLERKLDEMCQSLSEIDCPPDMLVEIKFTTDPAALVAVQDLFAAQPVGAVLQVTLPTPTLVGLPVDETAYQALFRGYAAQLVSAVVSHLVDFTCCRHAVFHQALLHHQLSQLSLKPWPVSNIDYQRILDEQLQIADIDALWRSEDVSILSGAEGWRVYAFLDYLLESYPALTAANMQRELVRHESIYGWLEDSISGPIEEIGPVSGSDLLSHFWIQAYTAIFSTGSNNSSSSPAQDLQIVCSVPDEADPSQEVSRLYHYNLRQEIWTEEYSTANSLYMAPLPDDESLILMEFDPQERWWQSQLWRDETVSSILDSSAQHSVSFGATDPDGSSLMAFVFPPNGDEAIITLFDLTQCDNEGCNSRALPSIPIWSPDGSQAIFTDEPNAQLALLQSALRTILFDSSAETPSLKLFHSDRQNLIEGEAIVSVSDLTEMGMGHAPFWLDDETVGYITVASPQFSRPGQEIVITPPGQDDPQVLLSTSELTAAIPDPASVERNFWIHYAMIHPLRPDLLFIVAMSGWDEQAHLFTFDRISGQVQHLTQNSYSSDHTLSLTSDGRYQVMTGRDLSYLGVNRDNALLLLHDLARNTTVPFLIKPAEFAPFPTYDWSSDGEWLAMMLDHDLIGLFAPQNNELKLVENAPGKCSSPAWINR